MKEEKNIKNQETLLTQIRDDINKKHGEGTISTLERSKTEFSKDGKLSTGSLLLDKTIGGGYSFGKIVEIYGLESSGKSTLGMHAVKECQKIGKIAVFIDLENSLDEKYCESMGISKEQLLIVYPKSGENALDLMIELIEKNVGLIILDSISALVSEKELESKLEDSEFIGIKARMMSKALPKINNALTKKNCVIIFINQLRNKISTTFFPQQTTTGGVALTYFAGLRLKLTKKEEITQGGKSLGMGIEVKSVKNKWYDPQKTTKIEIIFGKGIEKIREIIDIAEKLDIISKSGNWYYYGELTIGNGKENSINFLKNNESIMLEIREKIKNSEF